MVELLALAAGVGTAAVWIVRRVWNRRSYAFRLGNRGLWIDREFYHWHRVIGVTHYQDLNTLLVKITRPDEVTLALLVDLRTTPARNWPPERIRGAFETHVANLVWKSV